MSKTNDRPRGPEADVAARVALERQRQGLSAAELARRMTRAGCAMNQSAIARIEQYDPPRRITVDELVAFAKVFDLEIYDLLLPPHDAFDRELVTVLAEVQRYAIGIGGTSDALLSQMRRLEELVTPLDAKSEDLATSISDFHAAFDGLLKSVAASHELTRKHLSEGRGIISPSEPPLETSALSFRPKRTRDSRAADAVAGIRPSASKPPRQGPRAKTQRQNIPQA